MPRSTALVLLLPLAFACGGSPNDDSDERAGAGGEPRAPSLVLAPREQASSYPVALGAPGPYRIASRADGSAVASRSERTLWLAPDGRIIDQRDFGGHVALDYAGRTIMAGELDGWVTKLDEDRNVSWKRHLGTDVRPRSLATDSQGHVVVTGSGIGTVALDARDGKTLWHASLSGRDLAVDSEDNVTLIGGFIDALELFGDSYYSDQPALFVARLDARGTPLWSRVFSGPTELHGHAVATDRDGNAFVAGTFHHEASLGGPVLEWRERAEEPYEVGFVAKYDRFGNHVVSRVVELAETFEMIADGAGNLFLTGHRSDAEPLLDLRVLAPSCEDLWDIRGPRGYGFDIALDAAGALYWSVDAQEGPVLSPWLLKLQPPS